MSFRVGLKSIVTGTGAAVGLNGGSCIQSSLERTAFPEPSVRRGMRNRGHNSGMTPVHRKAGTGERTREPPGNPGIFIVLSGFATTDLSVRFCDACQGAEPMETGNAGVLFRFRFLTHIFFCCLSPESVDNTTAPEHAVSARRSRTTERSEPVSEEAAFLLQYIFC